MKDVLIKAPSDDVTFKLLINNE